MKVLFIVPYAPTRIRTRPYHLIRALAASGHEVTVATLWGSDEERDTVEQLRTVAADVVAERQGRPASAWNCLRALPTADPLQAHYSWNARLASRVARLVGAKRFDVVHVEHLRGVRYGLELARRPAAREGAPALVWDSVDCISTLFRRAAAGSALGRARLAARLELGRTERFEPSVASRFDRVLMTAETDRQDLLRLAEHASSPVAAEKVTVLANGVDLQHFQPPDGDRDTETLVVTGKMSYHANATGVVWFVRSVMPEVWSAIPNARVLIVGKDPPPEVARLADASGTSERGAGGIRHPRVVVTGTVDDLRPFLRRAALAVAPLQYAVGIQNKVLEAMGCATPVVATATAVAGLDVRDGAEAVVASSPRELAEAIIALLGDPARREALGRAGRAFVERRHDWAQVGARLAEIYRDVA